MRNVFRQDASRQIVQAEAEKCGGASHAVDNAVGRLWGIPEPARRARLDTTGEEQDPPGMAGLAGSWTQPAKSKTRRAWRALQVKE
jgi:hypothetical protein